MTFLKQLGSRIKAQREELGYTQKQLSDKLSEHIELSEKQISVIERGLSGTTLENFLELSKALGKTPDYFFLGITRGAGSDEELIRQIIDNLQLCTREDLNNLVLISRIFAEKKENKKD